jgi:uncharacterized lipoprotein YehR (DUF1307 family)
MKDITTEEAVEKLKDITNHFKNIKTVVDTMEFNTFSMDICEAIEKVLNELEKKDKIINAMTEYIDYQTYRDNEECEFQSLNNIKCPDTICTDCIKQYFERKVTE